MDFIERTRALHPELFRHKGSSLLHEDQLLNEPDYLSEEIIVRLSGEGAAIALDAADQAAFVRFLHENKYQADTSTIRSHDQLLLNSFRIRTMAADSTVQTSDSIVCARFGDEDDETYVYAALSIRCYVCLMVIVATDLSRLRFGMVDLIIEIPNFHPFLAVRWFRPVPTSTPSTEDVSTGVAVQYARPPRAHRQSRNMWVSVEDIFRGRCLYSDELGACLILI
jgi:hypothetical protein